MQTLGLTITAEARRSVCSAISACSAVNVLMISRRSFVALQHRNFRLIWIGLFLSFTGSTMQNAALLWQVSLLVPSDQKGLALGLVGLVRVVPIVVFSMVGGVVADAWNRRKLMLFTQTGSAIVALSLAYVTFRGPVERVADLRAGGAQFRGGRVRSAGAARAGADAGAARASAECDRPQRHHVPDRVGRRPGTRRPDDRHGRPRLDLRGQRDLLRVRDRRAARRCGTCAIASRRKADRATTCRCTPRSKGCDSCSERRSFDRRCCSISSRRSFRRRRRCCRFSRRTFCTSARGATACCTRRLRRAR